VSDTLSILECRDALVAHIKAALPDLAMFTAALSDGDVDGDGDVMVTGGKFVRVFYRAGRFAVGRDQTALTYAGTLGFVVLVGAAQLGPKRKENDDALALVDLVLNVLAGKRLENLPSRQGGSSRPQVILQDVALFGGPGPKGTWYGISVVVEGSSQYESNASAA